MRKPIPSTPEECAAVREQIALRKHYADAGPEMVRLLKLLGDAVYNDVDTPIGTREELDAVLKAVQPKKAKR